MAEQASCPQCERPLPPNAPAGICPKCLMGAALQDGAAASSGNVDPLGATTPGPNRFVPPDSQTLAEHFPLLEIDELLGQGGMGAVYRARQTKLDRLVALKIMRPVTEEETAFAERFAREARTLARLSHPHIVAVHDFGEVTRTDEAEDQTGTLYFFLMEYVDGVNLRELMLSGELRPSEALGLVSQICDALQYAHDEGVVHRDIKPENILIDRRGRVKIADFGLARLAAQTDDNYTLTGTHQVMGTPRYMAPEQMSGSRGVDHRADLYSLGVVFYEMLTGELPLGRFEPPSSRANVDARLDEIVHRALASDPDQRYQRAGDIRTDVESIALEQFSQAGEVPGEAPPPFPGPSTILERRVAGVVDWLRPKGAGARPEASHAVSAHDREAIRQQVRAPAIGLMVFGALAVILATLFFITGVSIPSVGMIAGGAAILAWAALVICGGWHLLSLERLRPALLAAAIGQPLGLWPLIVLSRTDVRAAFAPHPAAPGFAWRFLTSPAAWGALLAGAGIAATFQPWAEIYNSASGNWAAAPGFAWPHGMIACFILATLAMFLLSTALLRPVPIWRPLLTAGAAIAVLACCVQFVADLKRGALAVQPLLKAASWGVEVGGRRPQTLGDWTFVADLLRGSYLLQGIALAIIGTAALDLAVALWRSTGRDPVPVDPTRPRYSGKAIIAACCHAGGVAMIVPSVVGLMIYMGRAVDTHPAIIITIGIWAMLGLVMMVAATILGLIALSEVRHSKRRLLGLPLAFIDAVLLPVLLLDAAIFGISQFAWIEHSESAILVGAIVTLVFAVLTDFLILRAAWRAAARPMDASSDSGWGEAGSPGSRSSTGSKIATTDRPPLARVVFTAPDDVDLGQTIELHFADLGYQLVDSQSGEWVFQRGRKLAAIWETDIRAYHTLLQIRAVSAGEAECRVSCRWMVRTYGGWITRGDIAKLEAEGRELESLLRRGSTEAVPTEKPTERAERPVSPFLDLDLRRIQMELKGPAGGLFVVALLGGLFWLVNGTLLIWDQWSHAGRLPFSAGNRLPEMVAAAAAGSILLLVVFLLIYGARHMRRLTGYEWCVAAVILALIPWSPAWLVGLPVGIWALRLLQRPDVRDAFLSRAGEPPA